MSLSEKHNIAKNEDLANFKIMLLFAHGVHDISYLIITRTIMDFWMLIL